MTEKKAPVGVSKQAQQLKELIARGKEQGFLTYAEVNDHLPNDIVDPEQIEDIVNMINDMGITVYEKAPDAEEILLSDAAVSNDDDAAAEEAEAALASVDAEFGRTTDPVRMYMREMGTVELLTREGELRIARRIEDGLNQVSAALEGFIISDPGGGPHRVLARPFAGGVVRQGRLAGGSCTGTRPGIVGLVRKFCHRSTGLRALSSVDRELSGSVTVAGTTAPGSRYSPIL